MLTAVATQFIPTLSANRLVVLAIVLGYLFLEYSWER